MLSKFRNTERYRVLIVIDHYLPGHLAGGPVTTVANMMERLGSHIDPLIVTRNTDLDGSIYPEITEWRIEKAGNADVLYLPHVDFTAQAIYRIANFFSIEYIYLNSFFSKTTISYLLQSYVYRLIGFSQPNIILAPRGEFSEGALRLKSVKKRAYIAFFGMFKLHNLVHLFQASSSLEKKDISRVLSKVSIHVAPDVAAPVRLIQPRTLEDVRLAFISRISPKKNLLGALEVLSHIRQPCRFDIYGPQEDPLYWQECEKRIAALPSHITVTYKGNLPHDKVTEVLGEYSAFLFPTYGENFGHVIFEALAAGCPVIVSDQTPWQDLEECEVGWVKPLADQAGFIQVIEGVLQDPLSVRQERAQRCMAYAKAVSEDKEVIAANLELFSK